MKRIIRPVLSVYAAYLQWKLQQATLATLNSAEKYVRLHCLPEGTGVDWLVDLQAYYEAAHILDAAHRAVKYEHETELTGNLAKYSKGNL